MDRITALVRNRLVLEGTSAFEAPYLAREVIAFGREIAIVEEPDVVRLAVTLRALGSALQCAPRDRAVVISVLRRRDLPPAARFEFIERNWLSDMP